MRYKGHQVSSFETSWRCHIYDPDARISLSSTIGWCGLRSEGLRWQTPTRPATA